MALGVPTVDDGPAAAAWLLDQGVELVELCGAFGPKDQARVETALGGAVPFGAVTYPCDQAAGLQQLFS
jgi:hypothetical protein